MRGWNVLYALPLAQYIARDVLDYFRWLLGCAYISSTRKFIERLRIGLGGNDLRELRDCPEIPLDTKVPLFSRLPPCTKPNFPLTPNACF